MYYELEVIGSWKEGETSKSHKYVDEKAGANVQIDDGSGPVRINVSEGGDFEPFDMFV